MAPARLLLEHAGIEIDARADYYGRTALIEAARQGQAELVGAPAREGGGRERADKTGRNSALIEAIKNRQDKVTLLLLQSGEIDFADKERAAERADLGGELGEPGDLRMRSEMTIRDFFERDRRAAAFSG